MGDPARRFTPAGEVHAKHASQARDAQRARTLLPRRATFPPAGFTGTQRATLLSRPDRARGGVVYKLNYSVDPVSLKGPLVFSTFSND